jgi:drug/metabolite transporter (DMT)-like permease
MQFSGQPVVVLMMLFLALWLGEVLYWQDWTAVALIALAIGTVLWPARPAH